MQAAFAVPLIGSRLSLLSYIFPCFVKHRILGWVFFFSFLLALLLQRILKIICHYDVFKQPLFFYLAVKSCLGTACVSRQLFMEHGSSAS